jgi:PTS system glucose-specific IIC component
MLPIAILPIAGLLLGIGGSIGANATTEAAVIFANIFKGMSDVIFGNLPILFCIAITITFSKDKGASGFSSAIAYLVFCSSQLAFLQFNDDGTLKSIM